MTSDGATGSSGTGRELTPDELDAVAGGTGGAPQGDSIDNQPAPTSPGPAVSAA